MSTINEGNFDSIALKLFEFQAKNNPVYKNYLRLMKVEWSKVNSILKIPFMPISFFKYHEVKTGDWTEEAVFKSSGTTATVPGLHMVDDLSFYLKHSVSCFEYFFGSPKDYHILALLPSYLERKDSSLVAMVDNLIKVSESEVAGFYLSDFEKLKHDLALATTAGDRKVILWGVSFALLDFLNYGAPNMPGSIIIETGGMKGRRRELTREEMHIVLADGFKTTRITSEYGMTELLSQAYLSNGQNFTTPPAMKVIGREVEDPLNLGIINRVAGLNVIDLANSHSVAFIETEDVGNVFEDGSFQVSGRLDNSDVRGCNLMVES